MSYDYLGDGLGGGVVCVGADELWAEVAVFHYAEGREEHSYAECYDSEATDGGDELVSAGGCIVGLPLVEQGVEVFLLPRGQAEEDIRAVF